MVMMMTERNKLILEQLTSRLHQLLWQYRQKPYLPIWGELFVALREVSQLAIESEQDVTLYDIHPTGQLTYHVERGRFVAQIPEVHISISMDVHECIESLLEGRFSPFPLN
ncbi:hypothetical protein ACI7RC_05070 [Brevibacillus sp. B_LB10_24]|uniref:hypothetical protein n=1 Tax=Brevibacillus sp. B_LB10_24 TaxID=3380645 RepID=UPI0038BD99BE